MDGGGYTPLQLAAAHSGSPPVVDLLLGVLLLSFLVGPTVLIPVRARFAWVVGLNATLVYGWFCLGVEGPPNAGAGEEETTPAPKRGPRCAARSSDAEAVATQIPEAAA